MPRLRTESATVPRSELIADTASTTTSARLPTTMTRNRSPHCAAADWNDAGLLVQPDAVQQEPAGREHGHQHPQPVHPAAERLPQVGLEHRPVRQELVEPDGDDGGLRPCVLRRAATSRAQVRSACRITGGLHAGRSPSRRFRVLVQPGEAAALFLLHQVQVRLLGLHADAADA